MLIMLYVKDEVSFDRFHKNVNNIYRIVSENQTATINGITGFLQGPRFTQNVPGIKSFVRVQGGSEDIKNGTEVQEQRMCYMLTPISFLYLHFLYYRKILKPV